MSYKFHLSATNKFGEGDIVLSYDSETISVAPNETIPFTHEQDGQTLTIDIAVPSNESVEAPTKFKIEITDGNYVLRTKNYTTFELKITNNSESTTNVTVGDNQ